MNNLQLKSDNTEFKRISIITLFLLFTHFLAGIVVNIYVQSVNEFHIFTQEPAYAGAVVTGIGKSLTNSLPTFAIYVIGFFLVLDAIIFLARATFSGQRFWIVTAILTFIGVIIAAVNGTSFINYGQNFQHSLFMVFGFLLAAIVNAIALYFSTHY